MINVSSNYFRIVISGLSFDNTSIIQVIQTFMKLQIEAVERLLPFSISVTQQERFPDR